MRVLLPILALAALSGCDGKAPGVLGSVDDTGSALDQQAIVAGILPDPENLEFAGRFETRSELGIDKFCAISTGGGRFTIGVLAVFGPESKCEGTGSARINGGKVQITLNSKDSCRFDAQYDGVELRFPGSIERGCASYCSDRASISGSHYFIIQHGDEPARRTLGRDIERLCN
jgi:hypothetical protein